MYIFLMKMRTWTGLIMGCFALSVSARPNIAVLELSGNGVEATDRLALTNRLRADLFKTDSFTVVERSQMDDILKEQGFQQTGCTDAACAVEVGKLLNVEYMISGSVDRVGSVFSVNIRMINVKDGNIVKNVTADCNGCTLEEVFIQTIRRAAFRLVGWPDSLIDTQIPTVSKITAAEPDGKRKVKYRGARTGPAGSVAVRVSPDSSEIFLEGKSYGKGSVQITGIPQGDYEITAKSRDEGDLSKKIQVWSNENTVTEMVVKRQYYFRIRPGYSFNTVPFPLTYHYSFPRAAGGTAIGEYTLNKLGGQGTTMGLGVRGLHNYFGLRFDYLVAADTSIQLSAGSGANLHSVGYDLKITEYGAYFDYSFIINILGRYLALEPGISAGFGLNQIMFRSQQGADSVFSEIQDITGEIFSFGGPWLGITVGFPRFKIAAEYTFLLSIYSSPAEPTSIGGFMILSTDPGSTITFSRKLMLSFLVDI
jgi:TolB-like protein